MSSVSFDVCILTHALSLPSSDCLSLYRQAALQAHWTSASVCTASNIYMKYEGGWHAKQPNAMCEAGGVFIEDMQCWQAGFDLSHIANRRCKSLIRLFSPPCRSVFYSSSLLFSFIKERRPYSRLHSIWAGVPTSILAEFNYAFPPFFFSRSRSPKALKLLLSFFHNNVPDIINLSQCSFRTVLCVCDRAGGGEGGEDWYKWHQSQAGSSLGLPSDAAFYGGGSPSCWCLQPVSASLLSPLCSLNLRDPSLGRFSYLIQGVIKIKR